MSNFLFIIISHLEFLAICLESADTASTGGLSHRSLLKRNSDPQNNSKHGVISKKILISLDVDKLARAKWKVDRGYSSGASSYGSNEDETSDHSNKQHHKDSSENGGPKVIVELPFDPKSIPPPKKSLHRNTSEVSCLSELRETIEKDGDLAKTIVRIEVCHYPLSWAGFGDYYSAILYND